ncbi:MAG: carboxypeptidase regulatory-like domain-containing protein [Oscillospiraceae bacterium]|nr:carboxypeptidase regulatory-like domain-containing protein [Oscillospiraceae bacterium]
MKKRVLALTVAMLLLLGLVPSAEITVGTAVEIRGLQTETGFDLTVAAAEELSAVLITFVCDAESGVYKGFSSHKVTLGAGGESEPIHFDCDSETEYIKAFLWEGLETLRPLIPVTVFSYKEPGSIVGAVWNDEDGNGERGAEESGIADVTVTIIAPDGVERKAVTGEDGSYKFEELLPGDYALKVTAPEGMVCTTPEAESTTVTVNSGKAAEHSVGYRTPEPELGAITVLVWNDENGDGKRGEEESGIAGAAVAITDAAGAEKKAVTGEDGSYKFEELPAGVYSLKVTAPEGMECTTPEAESATVTVKSGETSEHGVGYKTPKSEPKPEPEKIPLSEQNVWSTDRQDDNGVGNLFDGKTETYMAGRAIQGKPVIVTAELDRVYELTELGIGFTTFQNRVYQFDAEASLDGEEYFPILLETNSDVNTDRPLSFKVDGSAKYVRVRVYGYGGNEEGWVRINHFSLGGTPDEDSRSTLMYDDFEGQSGRLPSSRGDSRWYAYAIDEETYTDYTPKTGNDLYAEYADAPEAAGMDTALHIHDNADRGGSAGAGAVAAFRALSIPGGSADYTVSFRLFIPSDSENINWSGISLLSTPVTGGADLSAAAAVQLRLSEKDGRAEVNMLTSVQYNEGDPVGCFGNSFTLGRPWDVTMKVSPSKKQAYITIDDGTVSESRIIGYNCTDAERVNNQTWANTSVKYLAVNSGASGKADIYLDDLTVYCDLVGGVEVGGEKTVFLQDFETDRTLAAANVTQHVVQANNNGNDSSIGPNLQTTIAESGTFGGHVMKLTDNDGGNGLIVTVPLTVPDNGNKYTIKWRMRDFNPGNFSGFSLASGEPTGFDDGAHPFAFQLRYNLQDGNDGGGNGIQLYRYSATTMNGGSYGLFAAGGGSRLAKNSEWNVAITVNPISKSLEFKLVGGGRNINVTTDFSSLAADGSVAENWDDRWPDTLVFHTGAGASADCIIDDIEVIDTGIRENPAADTVHGIVRLEAQWGNGKYITQNGYNTPTAAADADPNRTRFIERNGLIGEGISFESLIYPGYYLVAYETADSGNNDVNHVYELRLMEYEDTAQFRAHASFNKIKVSNTGDYSGATVNYSPVWDGSRLLCYTNTSNDPLRIMELSGNDYTRSALFYLRSEAVNYVSDNFKAATLNSQWWTNYPWKGNNPTNDSYNFTALIDRRNVIIEKGSDGKGELFLKATKINSNDWPTNTSGETGINYNGSYGKGWLRWAGRVGVVSSQKIYNRQSLIEGSFKQPDSPIGYWNAFWLAGRDSWPPEIDIFEFLSSSYGHTSWHTAIHGQNDKNNLFGKQTNSSKNLTTGYHTFTLDWGNNYVKFYIDGQQYAKGANNNTIDFQKNMRLILNTGIGGWEKEPDSTMIWDDGMRVKWIRSFQY